MGQYAFVLLDADETLFDFARCEREALTNVFLAQGVQLSEEMILSYHAINDALWKQLERGEVEKQVLYVKRFADFCARYGLSCDPARLAPAYTAELSTKPYLIDGALEVCRALAERASLYIITNGQKQVQEGRLSRSPITALMKDIFISEEIGAEKPSLRYFEAVFDRIPDFDKERAIVVGDSLTSDIRGGVNAGLDTCWYNPHNKPVPADLVGKITYEIHELDQLTAII